MHWNRDLGGGGWYTAVNKIYAYIVQPPPLLLYIRIKTLKQKAVVVGEVTRHKCSNSSLVYICPYNQSPSFQTISREKYSLEIGPLSPESGYR